MQRLFVAVDLPAELRGSLSTLIRPLLAGARATPEDQLHLTLRFIGDVEPDRLSALVAALAEIEAPPLPLTLRGGGCFPARGDPHVIFAAIERTPLLTSLVEKVEEALFEEGIAPEERPFHPHITVARPKHIRRRALLPLLEALGQLGPLPFQVSVFRLYSSVLTQERAQHQVEGEYPLR